MKPNMSTLFSIHLPISVATLVPIRNAKWLPVEIRSYQQTIAVNKIQTRKAQKQTNHNRPRFFSKIHRQKNATLVQYGKWLNSGDNGDSLLKTIR
jgi:hypothetical protein